MRRRKFFQGRRIRGSEIRDLVWFRADGQEMTEDDWNNAYSRSIGLRLAGDAIAEVDARGNPITDDTLLLLFNAHHESVPWVLPADANGLAWELLLDTNLPNAGNAPAAVFPGGSIYQLEARSLAVFRW